MTPLAFCGALARIGQLKPDEPTPHRRKFHRVPIVPIQKNAGSGIKLVGQGDLIGLPNFSCCFVDPTSALKRPGVNRMSNSARAINVVCSCAEGLLHSLCQSMRWALCERLKFFESRASMLVKAFCIQITRALCSVRVI